MSDRKFPRQYRGHTLRWLKEEADRRKARDLQTSALLWDEEGAEAASKKETKDAD